MVRIRRLDNGNVRVHIDCRLRTGSVRQYFSMPKEDGPRDEEPTPFAEILARSFRWKDMLLTGTCGGKTALAQAVGIHKSNLIPAMRLPYLSPVIVEKAMDSELEGASFRGLCKIRSPFWYDQHKALGLD